MTVETCPPHRDSGGRCIVAHYDKHGTPLPSCFKCSKCNEWIEASEAHPEAVEDFKGDWPRRQSSESPKA